VKNRIQDVELNVTEFLIGINCNSLSFNWFGRMVGHYPPTSQKPNRYC